MRTSTRWPCFLAGDPAPSRFGIATANPCWPAGVELAARGGGGVGAHILIVEDMADVAQDSDINRLTNLLFQLRWSSPAPECRV